MPAAAGRLAGALRFTGRADEADRILTTMRQAKCDVRESNPFEIVAPRLGATRERSPYVMRLQSMWAGWRDDILSIFARHPDCRTPPRTICAMSPTVTERMLTTLSQSGAIESMMP